MLPWTTLKAILSLPPSTQSKPAHHQVRLHHTPIQTRGTPALRSLTQAHLTLPLIVTATHGDAKAKRRNLLDGHRRPMHMTPAAMVKAGGLFAFHVFSPPARPAYSPPPMNMPLVDTTNQQPADLARPRLQKKAKKKKKVVSANTSDWGIFDKENIPPAMMQPQLV